MPRPLATSILTPGRYALTRRNRHRGAPAMTAIAAMTRHHIRRGRGSAMMTVRVVRRISYRRCRSFRTIAAVSYTPRKNTEYGIHHGYRRLAEYIAHEPCPVYI